MDSASAVPELPTARADAAHSRFVQRVRRRYGDERSLMRAGVPDSAALHDLIEQLRRRGHDLAAAMRIARQLCIERLAVLDVEQEAPLEEVTGAMTALAEVTLGLALAQATAEAEARHGVPGDAQGERIDFWIVGMGKLGARELNVSSDMDLIYVYGDASKTDGLVPAADGTAAVTGPATTAHEFFAGVAKRLYALIGDTTEHGFVFRMDLALRPHGQSGPPVCGLPMLEDYFQAQGREWERFAWLKSRVVAPLDGADSMSRRELRSLVTAFVYRRYLDYGVFEGLRQLHRKIRDEAQRRAAGRPERANDVKLSRGGIREIEFIVQLMLVVRGGQFPEIRTRGTVSGLKRLTAHGLMKPGTADALTDAYRLLRRIEHRIQYLDDQQTHLLPTGDGDLAWIAASLGDHASACELLDRLGQTREFVATEFDALLHEGQPPAPNGRRAGCVGCTVPTIDSEALIERLPVELADRVRRWAAQPRVASLRDDTKLRLGRLVKRAGDGVAAGSCDTAAALRFIDWLEPLLRRESYLALLVERPEVQRRLLHLLGLARWPMQYLMRHPGVIDELADERLRHGRFSPGALIAELEQRHTAWQRTGQADEEALLDTLRHAHHAELFRTLVRDVEGELTVEQVADDLSALADAVLETTLRWAWSQLKQRHRDVPRFGVIAYGKLGGKELGYGSDLDVVFVYDADGEPDRDRAQEVYANFVRKIITWLTLRTGAGELFDIDTALRPNGGSGLLVTSIEAYARYQVGRGSNTAWTWEHQAITRARFCAGAAELAPRFDDVRRQVLTASRDAAALKTEVLAMRDKVRQAHAVRAGRFDLKHSPGGMIDAEFAVQYLVLAHAARHAALIDNVGNIALLQRAEDAGLLPAGVGRGAADAYRELRRAQHLARLDEQPTQVDPATITGPIGAVTALWRSVFD